MVGCGAAPIVVGGWGIDALLGSPTRQHRDLDVLVQNEFVSSIVDVLLEAGYEITTDWLPVRIELSDAPTDRHVDIRPIVPDGTDGWWQHGPDRTRFVYPAGVVTTGVIGAVDVQCVTPTKQRELHSGYVLREQDRDDLEVLDGLVEHREVCHQRTANANDVRNRTATQPIP